MVTLKTIFKTLLMAPLFPIMGVVGAGGAPGGNSPSTGVEPLGGSPTDGTTQNTDPNQGLQDDALPAQKTFTQEEVNALMAREKAQGKKAILKELGVEDVASAKKNLADYKALQDAQKTELEKAQDLAQQVAQDKLALEQQLLDRDYKMSLLMSGCQATKLEDAYLLAKARTSDTVPFDKAVEQVKQQYPEFFGENSNSSKGTGQGMNVQRKTSGTQESLGARLASNTKSKFSKNPYFSS